MIMTVTIIITSILTLLAIYGTLELGIDIMGEHLLLGFSVMVLLIILLITIYYLSIRFALRRKQKKFLIAILVVSIFVLGLVIFRVQITVIWNNLFRTICGPGGIPNAIELN